MPHFHFTPGSLQKPDIYLKSPALVLYVYANVELNSIKIMFCCVLLCFDLRQGRALSPRLPITTLCSLDLPGLTDPPASASPVTGTLGTCHYTLVVLNFFFVERGSLHVAHTDLEFLVSGDPPALPHKDLGLQA